MLQWFTDCVGRIELNEQAGVKMAASVFREFCYDYRDTLVAGIIVAGWDKHEGGQVKKRNENR